LLAPPADHHARRRLRVCVCVARSLASAISGGSMSSRLSSGGTVGEENLSDASGLF
jgi:hypothetical protein